MADVQRFPRVRQWTVEDFEQERDHLLCRACREPRLVVRHIVSNNALRVECACGERMPLGRLVDLKQTTRKTRQDYPHGETLDDVWARFEDRCVVCSAPKAFLLKLGIPLQRQHVMEYAKHGHQGPLVPMCGPCHENATQRQKLFWFWYRRVHGNESPSGSRTLVSGNGAPSDPLPAAEQDPDRQLEGLPDHHADD